MICESTIRRFDGDSSSTLHAAIVPRGWSGLRFVAWVTIDKGTGRYAATNEAPAFAVAWVPAEKIPNEDAPAQRIEEALGDPDQVPLLVEPRKSRAVAYVSDAGAPFPTVGIKGSPMVLVARVESIAAGTHGQLTFGWRTR